MKVTVIPVVTKALVTIPKGFGKETGRFRNRRTSGDHPDYRIFTIGQDTEKSPRDLLSFKLQ